MTELRTLWAIAKEKEMTDTRKYNATNAQLLAIEAKLQAEGFSFNASQNTGKESARGFDLEWTIASNSISISVVKHPFGEENIFWHLVEKELGPPVKG
jgi:hypothetical protein